MEARFHIKQQKALRVDYNVGGAPMFRRIVWDYIVGGEGEGTYSV